MRTFEAEIALNNKNIQAVLKEKKKNEKAHILKSIVFQASGTTASFAEIQFKAVSFLSEA